MTPKRKRLWLLVGSLGVLGVAAALVLSALFENLHLDGRIAVGALAILLGNVLVLRR